MTLQEAIMTGKPFKRPEYLYWNFIYIKDSNPPSICHVNVMKRIVLSNILVDGVFTSDWYVDEKENNNSGLYNNLILIKLCEEAVEVLKQSLKINHNNYFANKVNELIHE